MHFSSSTFTYMDAEQVTVFVRAWEPEKPVAAIQIAHGIGEHSGRYDVFARELAANGFAVYANDHRGHGETGRTQWNGDLSKLGKLGPGGLRAAEATVAQLTGIIRDRNPGLRVGLFAHSWGSLMAQRMMQREPHLWNAVILSGSAFRTFRFMESGPLNNRWKAPGASGFEWLSSDTSVGEKFLSDELNFGANILKLFGPADATRLLGTPKRGLDPDVPVLIIGGGDDPLSKSDGIERLAKAYRHAGVRSVQLRVWPGSRHELLNEPVRDEVVQLVTTWFADRLTDHSLEPE
ncbi:MAG: alpha/beta fold hydrolase [Canibacter sp.]